MASLKIEERFRLQAPPEAVWGYLTDPSRVVTCLPGASLDSSSDDGRTHGGSVKVKLGAVTISYKGTAEFTEVDDDTRRMKMAARGREKSGRGSVSMTMESSVAEADGGSEVHVQAEMQLAGKIVQFGRGMIDVVSQELFRDFTRCLAASLGGAEAPTAGEGAGAAPQEAEGAREAPGGADTHETAEGGPSSPGGNRGAEGAGGAAGSSAGPEALDGFALLVRVLRAWLRRLFGGS